jgi:hypothetical protein
MPTVRLPGDTKARARKGKVVSAEIPQHLYRKVAGDAAIGKRSVSKQLEFILESFYAKQEKH